MLELDYFMMVGIINSNIEEEIKVKVNFFDSFF